MVLKLKSARTGGLEFSIKQRMLEENLKFPIQVNAEIDNTFSHPIHRITDAPFKGMAAGNFKYEVISE